MLRKIWIELRSSLWFVPGVLVIGAIVLALGLVQVDVSYADALGTKRWQPMLNAGAEGARGMLTAIASSMISVAGMAFSITIVTLSLASTQYTPRILRNFMRDRANQFVLGIFVAIYTYCLIVLRTIRGGSEADGGGFVPLLAVAFGMGLALLSVGCLIFFIHHVAASIQASSILQAITQETVASIDTHFPDEIGEDDDPAQSEKRFRDSKWIPVASHANGYIQHVDAAGLLEYATGHGAVLWLDRDPGDFATAGSPILFADQPVDEGDASLLRSHFAIGDFRTVEQDAGFGIRQIVDIALKALSPGVNDTSTAVSCLDYLGAILCRLATQRLVSPYREEDGELRVIAPSPDFAHHVARAFDEIRLSAASNVSILLQMLAVIQRVAGVTRSAGRRKALLSHAQLVTELADGSVRSSYDRGRINAAADLTRDSLSVGQDVFPPIPPECADKRER